MSKLDEIARLSAAEMRRRIGCGELSPVEVVEACLAQVERHNGVINAVCTLSDRALDEAWQAEKALKNKDGLGLLHGLPVGIKDVTPTAGLRTTFGSPLHADYVPSEDALIVSRLKAAGAVILGKTNTPEFAAGANTFNDVFGATRNPWNPELSAGGSTGGGAAALACGMIALADGTDLGGSLRIPASFCGVAGLRPSPGLVPTHPADFLWDTLAVSGPMARTVQDVALMLQAIAGPTRLCPLFQPVEGRDFVSQVQETIAEGMKLAYCPDIAGIGVDPEIEKICRTASFEMSQAGAMVEEIEFDLSFGREAFWALRGLWMVNEHFKRLDQAKELGDNLRGNLRAGLEIRTRRLAAAEQARGRIWHRFYELFQKFDHLLTPCTVVPPFPVEQNYPETVNGKKMETYVDWFAPTSVLSLAALPVASVPCGLTSERLPVGLQIVGPPLAEESVLAVARTIEEAHPVGPPPLLGSVF